jgi:hypothetical protein
MALAFVAAFRATARASAVLALLAAACAWIWVGRENPIRSRVKAGSAPS